MIDYPAGSGYWRVALGASIAGDTRHVRWFIRANSNAACGRHSFESQAFFTQAGTLFGSPFNEDIVTVACLYLPLILWQ